MRGGVERSPGGHGRPEIMNTDQGSPFTSVAFLTALQDAKIAMSMDGKGAWRDNVFVERLWRTITDGKSTSGPTEASRRRVAVLVAIWRSTTGADRIHRLAGKRPIKPLSTSQRQARRRHNQRGDPLIDSSQPVQNSPATFHIGIYSPLEVIHYDNS